MIAPSRSIDEMDAEAAAGSPNRRTSQGMTITTAHASPALPAVMKEKTRTALHRFFYPHQHKEYLGTQSTRGVKSHRTPVRGGETEEGVGDPATGENENPLEPPPLPPEPPSTPLGEHSHGSEILHTPTDRHAPPDMNDPDVKFVTNFWTTFDDILILSIFTQLGIVFRIAIAIWFTWFDGVFSNDSALFVNLPLNCLSCFLMGVLCSGERLMEIITTRFSPPRTQHEMVQHGVDEDVMYEYNDDEDTHDMEHNGGDGIVRSGRHLSLPTRRPLGGGILRRRRRRQKKEQSFMPQERFISWQPPVHLDEELRDVQLLALERRIRMSKCLVLFPVRKQDVDVMEHYFQQGYKRNGRPHHGSFSEEEEDSAADHRPPRPRRLNDSWNDLDLREEAPNRPTSTSVATANDRNGSAEPSATIPPVTSDAASRSPPSAAAAVDPLTGSLEAPPATSDTSSVDEDGRPSTETAAEENATDYITDFANNIQDNVQENLYRLGRVNLADGWDSGTTAEAMSDDLMLGLRDGFCGALSSFSSWNSAMVSLLRHGNVGQAVVGYIIGLQLPIVAYRFGQHVAVYIFVWRTRRETRKDERRGGYGIRLSTNDDLEQYENSDSDDDDDEEKKRKAAEDEMPSLRAVITAIFIMALVTQITSIFFFDTPENQQIALSLLFSPLGVFARWRLAKLNRWKPTFPIGTFSCNILSCALSGSLGTLLSGNIGENQEIVLSSIVNGFGGTLSSLASFVVEILAGVDPILLRYDGVIYAAASIGCAMVVGFIFSASVEWADVVTRTATATATEVPSAAPTIFNATDNLTRYW